LESRAQIDTSPPQAAKPMAMALPIPRLPPQTIAFLPVKSSFISLSPVAAATVAASALQINQD
jgi:hypothetical protein